MRSCVASTRLTVVLDAIFRCGALRLKQPAFRHRGAPLGEGDFSPRGPKAGVHKKNRAWLPAVRVVTRSDGAALAHGAFGFVAFVCSCAVAAASAFGAKVRKAVDLCFCPFEAFCFVPGDDVAGDECVWLAVVNGSTAHSAWES
jgi:hypothetical protein